MCGSGDDCHFVYKGKECTVGSRCYGTHKWLKGGIFFRLMLGRLWPRRRSGLEMVWWQIWRWCSAWRLIYGSNVRDDMYEGWGLVCRQLSKVLTRERHVVVGSWGVELYFELEFLFCSTMMCVSSESVSMKGWDSRRLAGVQMETNQPECMQWMNDDWSA